MSHGSNKPLPRRIIYLPAVQDKNGMATTTNNNRNRPFINYDTRSVQKWLEPLFWKEMRRISSAMLSFPTHDSRGYTRPMYKQQTRNPNSLSPKTTLASSTNMYIHLRLVFRMQAKVGNYWNWPIPSQQSKDPLAEKGEPSRKPLSGIARLAEIVPHRCGWVTKSFNGIHKWRVSCTVPYLQLFWGMGWNPYKSYPYSLHRSVLTPILDTDPNLLMIGGAKATMKSSPPPREKASLSEYQPPWSPKKTLFKTFFPGGGGHWRGLPLDFHDVIKSVSKVHLCLICLMQNLQQHAKTVDLPSSSALRVEAMLLFERQRRGHLSGCFFVPDRRIMSFKPFQEVS